MTRTILNIDDDEAGRFAVTHNLRTAGFEVREAATGAEGLKLVDSSVDLVLLDVNLPDIDGMEVCRRIKSDPRTRTLPVIHLSAARMSQPDRILGLDSGADAYLTEPIGRDELVATVQAHIRARRAVEREARRHSEFEQQLVGIVSHDLRTPLSAIQNTATLLEAHTDPKVVEAGARIARVSGRMTRMVTDLLDYTQARIGQGIALQTTTLDLVALLKRTVDEALSSNAGRIVDIKAPSQLAITADSDRLEQVIGNLLGNALRHSPDGSTVSVEVERNGGQTLLTITNANRDGPIPAELLAVLFEPFTRGRSNTTESFGLGLFIVNHLVQAHGGDITVQSDHRATQFTVRLPQ